MKVGGLSKIPVLKEVEQEREERKQRFKKGEASWVRGGCLKKGGLEPFYKL